MVDNLHKFVEEKSAASQFSGVLLLVKNGKPILKYTSGMANKETGISNTLETKFNLGSATKMFTGVAIAQLIDDFNTPIGKILPDYPNKVVQDEITIQQLLTHTSGLGSFIDVQFRDQFLAARRNLTTIQSVVDLFKDRPLPYKTGEVHYSSDGYEILGLIIEKLSGISYYDCIKKNIYDVADMPNSTSFATNPAIGYSLSDPKVNNLDINFFNGTAGGSSYSTCGDLLNFTQALQNNKLLSPEKTELVMSPKVEEGRKGNQIKYNGYGFQIFDIDGIKRIGHPGRFAGVNTRIDMYPSLGYTCIVLANLDPPSAFDIAEKASELILQL